MDDSAHTRTAADPQPSHPAAEPEEPALQDRFPFSTKEMIQQIYVVSGAVIILLSLAIWLMISLS
ncbi:MAG: hypothetical protein ACKOAO_12355 [Oxalobacteraceae bacterium]|jgi:hypothetical protein